MMTKVTMGPRMMAVIHISRIKSDLDKVALPEEAVKPELDIENFKVSICK